MGFVFVQSLCQILEASVNMGSRVLETQIDGLLLALHQQVCLSLFYTFSLPLFASTFSIHESWQVFHNSFNYVYILTEQVFKLSNPKLTQPTAQNNLTVLTGNPEMSVFIVVLEFV